MFGGAAESRLWVEVRLWNDSDGNLFFILVKSFDFGKSKWGKIQFCQVFPSNFLTKFTFYHLSFLSCKFYCQNTRCHDLQQRMVIKANRGGHDLPLWPGICLCCICLYFVLGIALNKSIIIHFRPRPRFRKNPILPSFSPLLLKICVIFQPGYNH